MGTVCPLLQFEGRICSTGVQCSGRDLVRPGRLHTKTQGQTHCAGEEQEKEIGWGGKATSGDWVGWEGKGWEGYIRRLVEVGREGDGMDTSGDWEKREGKGIGMLHKKIVWGGKGRGWEGYIR